MSGHSIMAIELKNCLITIYTRLLIVAVIAVISYSLGSLDTTKESKPFLIVEEQLLPEELSYEEEVYRLLCLYKIQNKHIVLAQAKLESGGFTSSIFLESNNIVNMKVPGQRPTLARKCDDHVYAEYPSIEYSVIDYALWQCAFARNLSEQKYYERLVEVGFAEDTLYIHKLRPIVEQLKQKYGE